MTAVRKWNLHNERAAEKTFYCSFSYFSYFLLSQRLASGVSYPGQAHGRGTPSSAHHWQHLATLPVCCGDSLRAAKLEHPPLAHFDATLCHGDRGRNCPRIGCRSEDARRPRR